MRPGSLNLRNKPCPNFMPMPEYFATADIQLDHNGLVDVVFHVWHIMDKSGAGMRCTLPVVM